MFSTNEFLHFVFANRNDRYYCSELLDLDLNQYLWLRLHEQGYDCVYFLELSDRSICVRGYGDKLAQSCENTGLFRHLTRSSSLQKLMEKALKNKESVRSALVCDLGEFCTWFGADKWKKFLADLADPGRRTGILVLTAPPEAEASRSFLLNSPVFERIGEHSITDLRNASPCNMYAAIQGSKPDSMVYLNTCTRERLHSMLTRILMEDTKRTLDAELLPEMEDYLLQWMNNPELRRKERRIATNMPSPNQAFQDIFRKLQQELVWNQLTAKAKQVSKAGGIQSYLAALGCVPEEDPVNVLAVRRDPNSFAGRCLRLRFRSSGGSQEELAEIHSLLTQIRRQLFAPLNREDNALLADAVDKLIREFQAADDDGDFGTMQRVLFSINLCIQRISVPKGSSEERAIPTVIQQLQSYIQCSKLYYQQQKSLNDARSGLVAGKNKLAAYTLRQLEDQTEAARRMLNTYEDVIRTSNIQISSLASSEAFSELAKSLSEALSRQSEENDRKAAGARDTAADRTGRKSSAQAVSTSEPLEVTEDIFNI